MAAPSDPTTPDAGPPRPPVADVGLRDWEAAVYDKVSVPHRAWGADVLSRLELRGDEAALDAGCGTGRVTAELVRRLPRGRVVGVDGSPAMIEQARRLLPARVDLQVQDLAELVLELPVDAVISTATFHWIADHDRLFRRIAAVLRPGGRLEAQCGGTGNAASVEAAVDRLRSRPPWDVALTGWSGPWNFASPQDSTARLQAAGFVDVRCWLEPRPVELDDPHSFLRTVVLGSHLERLPVEAHDEFVEDVRRELLGCGGVPDRVVMDYVRLNISARRGEGGHGRPPRPDPERAGERIAGR